MMRQNLSLGRITKNLRRKIKSLKHGDLQRMLLIVLSITTALSILFSVRLLVSRKQTDQSSETILSTGQNVTLGNLTIKIDNVQQTKDYIPSLEPQAGEKLLQLHVVTTNNGAANHDFYPSIQTYVRDAEGVTYQMSPANISDPYIAGSIPSGGTKAGDLSYMVPERSVPLWLVIEDLRSNTRSVVIKIQN